MATQADIALAKWVQQNDPFLFEVAHKRALMLKNRTTQIHGIFDFVKDVNWGDIASSVKDTITSVAPALTQYKAQSKILKLQLEQAKKGLPPIDAAAYTPTVKVAAEVTPEMEAAATRVAQESIKSGVGEFGKYLPILGIGLAAMFFLKGKR